MCKRRFASVLAGFTVVCVSPWQALALTIMPVGPLDAQVSGAFSRVTAISADGSMVVGESRGSNGINNPIRWSAATGTVDLGNPSGSNSYATGVGLKANGEILVSGNVGGIGRRWSSTTGAWSTLAPSTRCTTSQANALAVTADGNDAWVTGWTDVRGGCGGHLFNAGYLHLWNTNNYTYTAYQDTAQCDMWAVAANGTAVGRQVISGQGDRAVYWSLYESMAPVNIPALANTVGQARAISSDAGTVVGYATLNGSSHAFLWRFGEATCEDLGTLPGDTASLASAVSADGSVVGGSSTLSSRPSPMTSIATIWDSEGSHALRDLLAAGRADLTGWVALSNVQSISADGTTVAGNGWYDADGAGPGAAMQMGFVATIPEPSSILLLAGLMLSLRRSRR